MAFFLFIIIFYFHYTKLFFLNPIIIKCELDHNSKETAFLWQNCICAILTSIIFIAIELCRLKQLFVYLNFLLSFDFRLLSKLINVILNLISELTSNNSDFSKRKLHLTKTFSSFALNTIKSVFILKADGMGNFFLNTFLRNVIFI